MTPINSSSINLTALDGGVTLPIVSVIISTLNDADGLKRTIDNLNKDKYEALEIIVIDGGSSDSTVDFLKSNMERISVFVSEPDLGIYDAWNKGLLLANGQYISFLGSGDTYVKNGLNRLVKCALENPQADFISARIEIVRSGVLIRTLGEAWNWQLFRHYMNATHAGSLHSRRLFDLYGDFDISYRIAGDYEFLLRAGKNLKAAYIDSVAVIMAADGVSHSGYRVFIESEHAKLKNNAVVPVIARLDRYVAQVKRFIRCNLMG